MKIKDIALNGLIRENPVFVLLLGMCPMLGVSTSALNGLGMGLATTFVLAMSNLAISSVKNVVPDNVRIPAFVVIIASFVTVVDMLMAGYVPALHEQLGIYIPLIVVNCIVLARAESFASKNNTFLSMLDGLFMGLGFTVALTLLGTIREFLGKGSFFDIKILPEGTGGIAFFTASAGGFMTLGFVIAIINHIKRKNAVKK